MEPRRRAPGARVRHVGRYVTVTELSDHIDWRGRLLVGIVTMKPAPWQLEDNYQRMEAYVREAARRRAGVVIAPECVVDGYVAAHPDTESKDRMLEVAQTVPDGPYIARSRELCRQLGVFLIFGFLERVDAALFNTCCLIDPNGDVLGKYSKVHPGGERHVTAGLELKPSDTPLGRIGFLICSDRGIGHNFDALGVQGVDVIFVPMNGGGPATWNLSTRAADNKCWIVLANAWNCAVYGPSGAVVLEKYECECVTVCQINLSQVPKGADRGHLAGRRPDLYGPLADTTGPQRFGADGEPSPEERQRREEAAERDKHMRDRLKWRE